MPHKNVCEEVQLYACLTSLRKITWPISTAARRHLVTCWIGDSGYAPNTFWLSWTNKNVSLLGIKPSPALRLVAIPNIQRKWNENHHHLRYYEHSREAGAYQAVKWLGIACNLFQGHWYIVVNPIARFTLDVLEVSFLVTTESRSNGPLIQQLWKIIFRGDKQPENQDDLSTF